MLRFRLSSWKRRSLLLPVEDPRVAELEAERAALQAQLVEAQKPVAPVEDPRVAELEAERAALQAQLAEAQKPVASVEDPRLNQLLADRETLQSELTARNSLIEELKVSRAKVESAHAGSSRRSHAKLERSATVRAELEELQTTPAPAPEPAGRWDSAESHLVFFQGPDGYELVERSGPPPSEGSSVDAQIVARVASAPIPGTALPCAYLVS